jgi:hypothetical protein
MKTRGRGILHLIGKSNLNAYFRVHTIEIPSSAPEIRKSPAATVFKLGPGKIFCKFSPLSHFAKTLNP